MDTKKFDFKVFFACVLLIILIIGCSVGVAFIVKDNVAFADSTNGIVEDNLIFDSDNFNSSKWVKNRVNVTAYDNYYRISPVSGGWSDLRQELVLDDYSQPFTLSWYCSTVSNVAFSLRYTTNGSTWTNAGEQYFNNKSLQVGYKTFNLSNISGIIAIRVQIMLQYADSSIADMRWIKLEYGSSFTGYVTNNYTNYGYNQGVEYGSANAIALRGYTYLDNLSLNNGKVSNFELDGRNYTLSNWSEDSESLGYYSLINFAMCQFVEDSSNPLYNEYVGGLYHNDKCYGNILITLPYVDSLYNDELYTILFVDTVTNERLYTTPLDTAHWSVVNVLGFMNGVNRPIRYYMLTYSSPNPIDIYFIANVQADDAYMWYPLEYSNFNVYASMDKSVLSSFDDGYRAGYDFGSNVAYNNGYKEGRAFGYNQGYEAAQDFYTDENGNPRSFNFRELFFSVVDAPLSAVFKIFDFNVFGYNLRNVILSLLVIVIVLFVIKKFII